MRIVSQALGMSLEFRSRRISLLVGFVALIALGMIYPIYRKSDMPFRRTPVSITKDIPQSTVAPQRSLLQEAEFAAAAVREISALDGTATLGQWKSLHLGEEPGEPNGYLCASTTKTDSLSLERQARRTAYFYPPSAPSVAVMPTLRGPALIDSSCTLAMIRVETPAQTPEIGQAVTQALKVELSKKYGKYETVGVHELGDVHFRGAGYWKEIARWRAGDVEIISAYEAPGHSYPEAPADDVFVYAELPVVNIIDHELCCTLKDYHYRSRENQEFHRAVALTGLAAPLRVRMDQLYDYLYEAYSPDKPGQLAKERKALVVSTLKEWMSAQTALPPGQQAAALFAADRLVAALEDAKDGEMWAKTSPLRTELEKIGATFSVPEISYAYTKNWLKQALQLAPESDVGQMAVLTFISRGNCDPTGWDSETVVSEAEHLLAKDSGEPTDSHLHFILGDAYADLVALGEGADSDLGADVLARYRDQTEEARTKALGHYRAAFTVDATSDTARDAWLQVWHLSAGLLPRTRYVCGDV